MTTNAWFPVTTCGTEYVGLFQLVASHNEVLVHLRNVHTKDERPFHTAQLHIEQPLETPLRPYVGQLAQFLSHCRSLEQCYQELHSILTLMCRSARVPQRSLTVTQMSSTVTQRSLTVNPHPVVFPPLGATAAKEDRAQYLVSEIESVGWQHLVALSPTFDCVTLQLEVDNRRHEMTINFTDHDTNGQPPTVSGDAPGVYHAGNLSVEKGMVETLVRRYRQYLAQFDAFWTNMEDLDAHTWVLEPPGVPSRSSTVRRIALSPQSSVQFEVSPFENKVGVNI